MAHLWPASMRTSLSNSLGRGGLSSFVITLVAKSF
jgi:hypothetical protein